MVLGTAPSLINTTRKGISFLRAYEPRVSLRPYDGNPNVVYRQGDLPIITDAIESGVVRPAPHRVSHKKPGKISISKHFDDDAMFNREHPFYG